MSTSVSTRLLPRERRAIGSIALIYLVRMFGLFLILPVFSLHAGEYTGATALLTGLAIGIYGLLQALLQIPFGLASDRFGRKPVIAIGLLIMAVGSAVAALADSIWMVILGRALQGAGAVASVLMALAADLSRDEHRTRVMAILGVSIGAAFILALIVGPALIAWTSIDSLFWVMSLLSLLAFALLLFAVPDPAAGGFRRDTGVHLGSIGELLRHPQLWRLDLSIFVLHILITATFLAVPLTLRAVGITNSEHVWVYLGAALAGLLLMVPLLRRAERGRVRQVLMLCVLGLVVVQPLLGWPAAVSGASFDVQAANGSTAMNASAHDTLALSVVLAGIVLFFICLNALEALLPSLVSRQAPTGSRGTAFGIYSASQFLGAFLGGVGAGLVVDRQGIAALHLLLPVLCLLWLFTLRGFEAPPRSTTERRSVDRLDAAGLALLLEELRGAPDVLEVTPAPDENAIYVRRLRNAPADSAADAVN